MRAATATHYQTPPASKNKTPGQWVPPGQSVAIGRYEVQGGFFYQGGRLPSLTDDAADASLIDPTLPIHPAPPDYSNNNMGYWPRYGQIGPRDRAAYIKWLASPDRADPACDIGYVFLYFYGLERRLLMDGGDISQAERVALVTELKRLKSVYGANSSFNSYVSGLLAHTWALYTSAEKPDSYLLTGKRDFTSVLRLIAGHLSSTGKPVPAIIALAWAQSHPDYSLRTPAKRCAREFEHLFKLHYQEQYGSGMIVKPNKTKLRLRYLPASPSLQGYRSVEVDLPDVCRRPAPAKKLIALAETCTDALAAYSRCVGKSEYATEALVAISHLPHGMEAAIQHEEFRRLKAWLDSKATGPRALIATRELLEQVGKQSLLAVNKKDAEMLGRLIEVAGYGLAPDVRFHYARPDVGGKVVLFRGGHGAAFKPSPAFIQVGTILRLGALVATVDGQTLSKEARVLHECITEETQLSDKERVSLEAYLWWALNTKAKVARMKARVARMNDAEKATVSSILVRVAMADGKADPAEIKQLETLYTAMGLDRALVSSEIHRLSAGQAAPTPPDTARGEADSGNAHFVLDKALLRIHKEETDGVKAILGAIFAEESDVDEQESTIADSPPAPSAHAGLDAAHSKLYDALAAKSDWPLPEVATLCKDLNLMPNGAVEVINDWAYDRVAASVIDIDGSLHVDPEIVHEITTHESEVAHDN